MSRIEEGDCDDIESFLRGCAFQGNMECAIKFNALNADRMIEEATNALRES